MYYSTSGKSAPVILDHTLGNCELLLAGDGMHINVIHRCVSMY